MGLGGLGEWVGGVDVRDQVAGACGLQCLFGVGALLGVGFGEGDAQRPGHSQAAPDQLPGIDGGPGASGVSVHADGARTGHGGLDCPFAGGTTGRVEHHVNAPAAGRGLHLGHPARLAVVNGDVGTESGGCGVFFGASDRTDHRCPGCLGKLDQQRPDPPSGSGNQYGVAGAHVHRAEDTDGDRAGLEHRDCVVERQADGDSVDISGLGEGQLRVAAGVIDSGGHNVLPAQRPVDIGPGVHHRARDLQAWHVRQREPVPAGAGDRVAVGDSCQFNCHDDLARGRAWFGHVLDSQDLRWPILPDLDSFHAITPCRIAFAGLA